MLFCFQTKATFVNGSASVWEHEKRKVATETNLYKRYGEFLFQKVASGYLLHFVQDGSSKNALETPRLRKNIKNQKNGEQIPINPPLTPIALRRALCRVGASPSEVADAAAVMIQ